MNIKQTMFIDDKMTSSLVKINRALNTTLVLSKKVDASINSMNKTLNSTTSPANKLNESLRKVARTQESVARNTKQSQTAFDQVKNSLVANFALGNLATIAIYRLIEGVKRLAVESIDLASDMVEVQNIINVDIS